MTTPTPPAVSEAMREAVLALLHVKLSARITGPAWEQVRIEWLGFGEVADALCAPAGPIASEIARLTGERDAAQHRCPIGLDTSPGICSAGTCYVCISDRCMWACNRAEAAEAETARLRAALEAADYLADRYRALWEGKTVRDLPEAEAAYSTASKALARAALTSQEQADV